MAQATPLRNVLQQNPSLHQDIVRTLGGGGGGIGSYWWKVAVELSKQAAFSRTISLTFIQDIEAEYATGPARAQGLLKSLTEALNIPCNAFIVALRGALLERLASEIERTLARPVPTPPVEAVAIATPSLPVIVKTELPVIASVPGADPISPERAKAFNLVAGAIPTHSPIGPRDFQLWSIAAQLTADKYILERQKTQFGLFFNSLRAILIDLWASYQQLIPSLKIDPNAIQVGSIAHHTNMLTSDMDIILVLNNSVGSAVKLDANKAPIWPDRTVVKRGEVTFLSDFMKNALQSKIDSDPSLTQKELAFQEGKCIVTLKMAMQGEAFYPLKVDILPALKRFDEVYLLLRGDTGELVPSNNQMAILLMGENNEQHPGLIDMIKLFKALAFIWKEPLSGLPSSAFEAAVTAIIGPRWKDREFDDIFRSALAVIHERLSNGQPLYPLNNNSDDLLRKLRAQNAERKQVEAFLHFWLQPRSSDDLFALLQHFFRR